MPTPKLVYKPKGKDTYVYDFWRGGRRFSGDTEATTEAKARTAVRPIVEQAEQWMREQRAAQASFRGQAPLTLKLAVERYWEEVGKHHAGAATTLTDLQRMTAYFGPARRMDDISDSDVAQYVSIRRGDKVKGRKDAPFVAPATVNRTTTDLLRKIFTRARKVWKLTIPNEPTWKNHRLKERGEIVRELKGTDETRVAEALGEGYRDLWRFALASGLRLGECFLRWPQIDWEAKEITVVQKGGRSHTIPLSRAIAAILGTCRGHHDEFVFTYVCTKPRRFASPARNRIKGKRYPVSYSGMKSEWRRHVKDEDGLDLDLRLHDMRHTRATRIIRATGNIKAAQRLLGHADIATTAKFYAHVTMDDVREILDAEHQSQNKSHSKKKKGA